MKSSLLIALCAFLLCSCQKKESTNATDNIKQVVITSNDLEKLSNELDGTWIAEDYLKEVENTLSIYNISDSKNTVLGFHLDKIALKTGNTILDGFTEHEGGFSSPIIYDENLKMFVNNMTALSEYPVFPEEFQLQLNQDNLSLVFPKSEKVEVYRKIKNDFPTELRKIVFAGTYQSQNNKNDIVFQANGKVENFMNYKLYEIAFDFVGGMEFDSIVFFNNNEGGNWTDGTIYKYQRTKSELILQKVIVDWETMEHKVDSNKIILKVK